MADILLSYSRKDEHQALLIVRGLEQEGWTVWFDRYTPGASTWEDVLNSELERARCIVMLWSSHTLESQWVPKEGQVGLERVALVPVLISSAKIPELFSSIQFFDLTRWNGDPAETEFQDLIRVVRDQMLPRCEIGFESLLKPRLQDLKRMYEVFFQITTRIVGPSPAGYFTPPSTPEQKRKFARAIASLQISIKWDSAISSWLTSDSEHEIKLDNIMRIERHMPLIWLRLQKYTGPFFYEGKSTSARIYSNFLGFASLRFFHQFVKACWSKGERVEISPPLTSEHLSYPRWEGAISCFFGDPDEIARAYVTHIDDSVLQTEEVFYGPKYSSLRSYEKTLSRFPFADPEWYERFMIPQRELNLALSGSTNHINYEGNARIRKVTDLDGKDLYP